MPTAKRLFLLPACLIVTAVATTARAQDPLPLVDEGRTIAGEPVDASAFGPGIVESMQAVLQRQAAGLVPPPVVKPPRPQHPPGAYWTNPPATTTGGGPYTPTGGAGTVPTLNQSFIGPKFGDAGAGSVPPDTCGSVGINHFVAVTNSNLSIYLKSTGARVLNTSLNTFLNHSVGDGRVTFDSTSNRWFVHGDDFSSTIYLAVSTTSDPTGSWFKTSINLAQGVDAGHWPDYPTLGVDANGVYLASYMVGAPDLMSLFCINKAPLIAATPSLGTVTAFRNLPWEGAIQPCVTWGSADGEYLVSRYGAGTLRLRRVNPPLSAPTLTEVGVVSVPSGPTPPSAPGLGSSTVDTLDGRPMNAVYRSGSVYTVNCVRVGALAGVHWYQIRTADHTLVQSGSIDDPVKYYFAPSISVNAAGHIGLGFSGSSPSQFIGNYISAHSAGDALGQTGAPVQLHAGEAGYTQTTRWGDYSLTSVDPTDNQTFWTIQEYAKSGNLWGTWIGKFSEGCPTTPDCNGNGIADGCDIANGTAADLNGNGVPDSCDAIVGGPYCSGDTFDPMVTTLCPCLNQGAAGHGCANSADSNGGLLAISGTMHPSDTLVLTASAMPATALVIFLKGDGNTGSGLVFGDGLRCVSGSLVRFGTQNAVAGSASYPSGAEPLLSVVGATPVNSGTHAYYQVYYRDPDGTFCPTATFNITNGQHLIW